jgi:UDP-N-acetylenolpyruvoylglucosamine reductase
MNAGAYGSEFEKVIDQVDGFTREGEPVRLSRNEMTFTYRDSTFAGGCGGDPGATSTAPEDAAKVSSRVRELVTKRKTASLPATHNSGSMFRNPPEILPEG